MHPILFKIGPVTIYTYGFFVATGLMLGISLALRQAKEKAIIPKKSSMGFFMSSWPVSLDPEFFMLSRT